LEIKQNLWLWPVGIITSAVYIWVFFTGKLYADTSLQVYYLVISVLGWYWWIRGKSGRAGEGKNARKEKTEKLMAQSNDSPLEGGVGDVNKEIPTSKLVVHRIDLKTGLIITAVLCVLYFVLWFVLSHLTDSPVPACDSFITSLSIVATWMLARKIYEHWYLWIVVDAFASVLFITRHLYPTVILYIVYCSLSFAGLIEWRKSLIKKSLLEE
ncbi:MAG: nicotinamide riboside transporter PnuC, partial [Bacteroidales bacterium]